MTQREGSKIIGIIILAKPSLQIISMTRIISAARFTLQNINPKRHVTT